MRCFLMFLLVVCLTSFLFAESASSVQLGGAKGKVSDALTGKAIAEAEVVATTSSDIESEQRYLMYSTKSGKDGSFQIKGIRGKTYEIRVLKEGYLPFSGSSEGCSEMSWSKYNFINKITIPDSSNVLIHNSTTTLLPLPPSEGIFVYAGKYIPLITKSHSEVEHEFSLFSFFKAEDLNDLLPMRPIYLIFAGGYYDEYINSKSSFGSNCCMYLHRLFRHSSKDNIQNHVENEENSGEYYANYYHSYGGKIGRDKYNLGDSKIFGKQIAVIAMPHIPSGGVLKEGYYFIGSQCGKPKGVLNIRNVSTTIN